jgi:PAS domain-containing protein
MVLAIALVGLMLGPAAAGWAWFSGLVVLLITLFATDGRVGESVGEVVRLAAFIIGSPIIVLLVHRSTMARQVAADALEGSRRAHEEAAGERRRLELARLEVDAALVAAERERARLEEVAEAIPEPLVVFDDQLRGTYGNRAALRLFGRSFVERPLEEWGRATEPRDDRGQPLEREEWPQVLARTAPLKRRYTIRVPVSGRDMLVYVEGTPIPGGGAVLMLRDVG